MVNFSFDRLNEVIDTHERWWRGELNRPLVHITLTDAHPVEKRTPAPVLAQWNCADFSWSAEQVIDAIDENLSRQEYLGDAFPIVNFDAYGPGVLAAMCGANLFLNNGNVWFSAEPREICDIHISYDPENKWARRIKDIYRAGLEKWNGLMIMGMPDLGGALDVAATFRGSENLLCDLYDAPDEVERLTREIETAWYEAYNDFANVLAPQKAYAYWCGLVSREPSYVLQCDFSYMIGNPMFKRFVRGTLERDTKRLKHTIYHLDGIGQLNHLDDLLQMENLDAIQWVYGDGKPTAEYWLDSVYRKIQDAGKRMQIIGSAREFLYITEKLHGCPYTNQYLSASETELIQKLLTAR